MSCQMKTEKAQWMGMPPSKSMWTGGAAFSAYMANMVTFSLHFTPN